MHRCAARVGRDFGYAVTVIHDACATCDQALEGQSIPAAQVHATYMFALAFAYASAVSSEQYLAGSN